MTDYELELERARAERERIDADQEIEGGEPPDPATIEIEWSSWLPAVAPKTYSAGFEWFHADFLELVLAACANAARRSTGAG